MAVDGARRQVVYAAVSQGGDDHRRRELERRLDYDFRNPEILRQALTHPSAVSDRGPAAQLESYQRLEFLGDRVLGLVVADMLGDAFPEADEGGLHRRHASLVRKETCAEVGAELGIGEALILGEGEKNSGGREKGTILGDACEAVIGAVYRDGGLEPARKLIERMWRDRMTGHSRAPRDAKSTLQEWAQGQGLSVPRYNVVGESGPQHAPRFVVRVDLDPFASATAEGSSKREAEQGAAAAVLVREGVWKAEP
jgi:ribonuclease-3